MSSLAHIRPNPKGEQILDMASARSLTFSKIVCGDVNQLVWDLASLDWERSGNTLDENLPPQDLVADLSADPAVLSFPILCLVPVAISPSPGTDQATTSSAISLRFRLPTMGPRIRRNC